MKCEIFNKQRADIYKFLSALYRDEISKDFVVKLMDKNFLAKLKDFVKECKIIDLARGINRMIKYLEKQDRDKIYKELSYEYADIFLNAGVNPAMPYESVHATGVPVVMQKSVFDVRAEFRKAGVHKSEDYKDLDDYIAVELEFVRYLLEKGKNDAATNFINNHLMNWIPEFHATLYNAATTDFYKGLSAFTLSFIYNDRNGVRPEYQSAIEKLSDAVNQLNLGDNYYTIAEGVKEEEPEKKINSHCYVCGGLCGITDIVKDGILIRTTGLKGDPKSGGFICPKGASRRDYVYSAYRLKEPLIREGERFRKATWDEALDLIANKLMSIKEHGKDGSVVGYMDGNDWNRWLHKALWDWYGTHNISHRAMCDNSIRMSNEHNLNDKRPWINFEESDYIIFFGQNPFATSYGRRQVGMLRNALKRGAKMVVVDPRKSEAAAAATEWIKIKPGTDGAMAMAMCYVIVKNNLYDKEFVENWTYGFEDFKKRLLGEEDGVARTPEWAEKICGVPASTIERIAKEFATAKNKGVGSWTGTAHFPNAMHTTAAVQALNALCGTFDAPGGPSLPFKRKLNSGWGEGQKKPPANVPPKLHKLRMWNGWCPSWFPEDVAKGRIKVLIQYFGDPVLSWGNEPANIKALRDLDFMVTIDAWMNNAGLYAHVVLPDCTAIEDSALRNDWLYEAFISYFAKSVEPLYNSRPWWWMCIELAKRMGAGEYFPFKDIEEGLRNMLKGTPWSFEEVKKNGYIITDKAEYYKYKKWGSLNVPEGYSSSGKTKTGKYNFKNPVAEEKGVDPLPDYKDPNIDFPDLKPDGKYPLIHGMFKILTHEHSSTFNVYSLMRMAPSNTLWIHPEDAKERGIKDGDMVLIRSPWAEYRIRAKVTEDILKGVVASAGGYGHKRGLEADPKFPEFGGANTGGLMRPNTPEMYACTPLLKYIKVQVEKA
ncbi:MAG TPA: molybdopterin oxidoreductase [Desulfobacteraceae bacterium]|nr:molybdopterin oxidoreductase [Desulfobacteraceae bacterium]